MLVDDRRIQALQASAKECACAEAVTDLRRLDRSVAGDSLGKALRSVEMELAQI